MNGGRTHRSTPEVPVPRSEYPQLFEAIDALAVDWDGKPFEVPDLPSQWAAELENFLDLEGGGSDF